MDWASLKLVFETEQGVPYLMKTLPDPGERPPRRSALTRSGCAVCMRAMRRLLALSLPLLLACSSTPAESPPAPTGALSPPPPPPSAAASAAPAPDRRTLCERLAAAEAEHDQALYAAARERAVAAKVSDADLEPLRDKPPALIGRCFAEPHGAWLTTLESVKLAQGPALELRWALAHVDEGGQRSQVVPSERRQALKEGEPNLAVGPVDAINVDLQPFDFDGDGGLEVWVGYAGRHHEGGTVSTGRIYTAKGGTVTAYAPAKGFDHVSALRDVDGDGRPDLLLNPFAVEYTACGSGFDALASGPALLAHSLSDGTFSTSDAAAVAAARKACPVKPKVIVESKHEGDVDGQVERVGCALVWGERRADLAKQIDRACKPPKGADCPEHACTHGTALKRAAEATPPLLLK